MSRRKVLVVDDSRDVHRWVAARLAADDIEVIGATSADEGFQRAVEDHPDLILLDVDMPGRDGLDACQELKRDPRTQEIAVIFLSGDGGVETKVRGFDLGAVDYIQKPFEATELRARIRSALRVREQHERLYERTRVDGLTQLYNRSTFDDRLAEELRRAAHRGSTVALLLVDIDHFKPVNDRFGHPEGDRVLREVAERLRGACRAGDIACRFGGEEFAVILPGVAAKDAILLAERIRAAIHQVMRPEGAPVTASVGVAGAGEGLPGELVSRADAALYRAKHAGRDRVELAEEG